MSNNINTINGKTSKNRETSNFGELELIHFKIST